MIVNTRVDRRFQVTDKDPLFVIIRNVASQIVPDQVHVWRDRGQDATLAVSGPILHAVTRKLSKRRGKLVYGRYGSPLDQAPAWVQDLAAKVQVL